MPLIKAVMTPFPHSIAIDAGVGEAKRMMEQHEIRHLPVVEGQRLVGIVSERDLLAADRRAAGSGPRVGDICETDVYVVELTERLDGVLDEMIERRIGSAVVVREGRVVGIFTTFDACRYLQRLLKDFFPTDGSHVA